MTKLALGLLVAVMAAGCDMEPVASPPPCQADPNWAPVVVWHSPESDCVTACGRFMIASLYGAAVDQLCVFTANGELP